MFRHIKQMYLSASEAIASFPKKKSQKTFLFARDRVRSKTETAQTIKNQYLRQESYVNVCYIHRFVV